MRTEVKVTWLLVAVFVGSILVGMIATTKPPTCPSTYTVTITNGEFTNTIECQSIDSCFEDTWVVTNIYGEKMRIEKTKGWFLTYKENKGDVY